MESQQTKPKLQPPGAGLPFPQRILLRYFVGPVVSKRVPLPECRKKYELITKKIIDQISKVPLEQRKVRILVDPIRGLEDSSRFWSLNEVLEHLLIVSKGIEAIILTLASGKTLDHVVDIAQVKPSKAEQDSLNEFMEYAPDLMKRIDEKVSHPKMDIGTQLSHRHPWFGNITARQWYWLLSGHQGIHYAQVKGIIQGLRN